MWFLRIIFDKKLQHQEIRVRKQYILENETLISELYKLDFLKKRINKSSLKDDLSMKLLELIDIKQAIQQLKCINTVIAYLWISRKDVESLQKHVAIVKDSFNNIINRCNVFKNIDGFQDKNPNSIFVAKVINLNIDSFSK